MIRRIREWWKAKRKAGYMQSEHYHRFIKPHYERGLNAGMTIEVLDWMLDEAWRRSYPPHINPGSVFRDMVTIWIHDHSEPK